MRFPSEDKCLVLFASVCSRVVVLAGLKASCFVGGFPVDKDKDKACGCHIAVGTPGRMRYLVDTVLEPKHARLFVLDEADKLMEPAFIKDIK